MDHRHSSPAACNQTRPRIQGCNQNIIQGVFSPLPLLLSSSLPSFHGGGASAVKEPGYFEVRKSSSQVTRSQGRSQDFLWRCTLSVCPLTPISHDAFIFSLSGRIPVKLATSIHRMSGHCWRGFQCQVKGQGHFNDRLRTLLFEFIFITR